LKVKISDILQEKPVKYKPTTWENKIIGIVRDRPVERQKQAYRILKETFRLHSD
ncbi:MAG: hypothetical protein HY746_04650, partial [Elusimicrobia bacterium]|nr:hypothetical protein [Elusimicrobiota bacterium]